MGSWGHKDLATRLDKYAAWVFGCMYLLANVCVLVPGWYRQNSFKRAHGHSCRLDDGFEYYTFADLVTHDHSVFLKMERPLARDCSRLDFVFSMPTDLFCSGLNLLKKD